MLSYLYTDITNASCDSSMPYDENTYHFCNSNHADGIQHLYTIPSSLTLPYLQAMCGPWDYETGFHWHLEIDSNPTSYLIPQCTEIYPESVLCISKSVNSSARHTNDNNSQLDSRGPIRTSQPAGRPRRDSKTVDSTTVAVQATGLDAWASRVKCPARFVSHLHEIL